MHYTHWILKYQGPCINRVLRLLWPLQEVSFIRGLTVIHIIPGWFSAIWSAIDVCDTTSSLRADTNTAQDATP